MTEKDFKHLIVDLDVTCRAIGRAAGISSWAVTLYFRGELQSDARRNQIKAFLARRAREKGIELPEFWPEAEAA